MVRFDRPCCFLNGAVEYFREHMQVGDYLTEGGRIEMVWQGEGANRLGLAGACRLAEFERVCQGLHPATGEKLMVRNKGAQRRLCYFGQISAPKDVSIALLVGGDQRIAAWWKEAVQETLREIEGTAATRVRKAGANSDRVTSNLVTAIVTHEASRALDPQLHTHLCVMNLTFDGQEGRWKGVQPSGFYRHQGYFREVCYNKLAERMSSAGYELERSRGIGFAIKGFPAELRDRFSQRRREILRQAREAGTTSQDAMQRITSESRSAKRRVALSELTKQWREAAGESAEVVARVVASVSGTPRSVAPTTPAAALASAGDHLFERRSVVDHRELLREALIVGRGQVTVEGLKTALERSVADQTLVRASDEVASRESLAAEREFTKWAVEGRRQCPPMGQPGPCPDLGEDQQKAVTELLESRDRVVILQGDAGTGKTTCLRVVVAGIERSGGQVFGCAPSTGAVDVLRKELTPAADTLQQLLVNEKLQAAVQGNVIIVDEAGLISARQMRDLFRLAERNENRVLLVGDTKQHSSVEAGDALRCLQQHGRLTPVRLTNIRRQRDRAYRDAVAALARGDAAAAFDCFARLGAVHETRSEVEMHRAAADDFVRTVAAGKSCLAISPVWKEIHAFTREVRLRLKANAILGSEERSFETLSMLRWTRAEKRRVENFESGDRLMFHRTADGFERGECATVLRRDGRCLVVQAGGSRERRLDPAYTGGFDVGIATTCEVACGERLRIEANHHALGLKNGDIVEVAGFADNGVLILKDGRNLPGWFRQFTHGYASTSHAAQGRTVDRGILLMGEDGIAAGNLKQAYVSNSRFRESQVIYTSDEAAARVAMGRPGERKLASEAVGMEFDESPPGLRGDWRVPRVAEHAAGIAVR
jgi:conjugative relaxase-like TrwC/TraI family protein